MGMREEFEEYAKGCGLDVGTLDGVHYHATVQGVAEWRVWQASRAALCVELPYQRMTDGSMQGAEVRQAIESAGVRVK